MLSIVDLIDAGTVDQDLAAFLLWRVASGSSFVIGARPGGAGKTTVMGALLNLLPLGVKVSATVDGLVVQRALDQTETRQCLVCHEIGRGSWYAYLWGNDVARLFQLPAAGHILATNLHADTLSEARQQICGDCGTREQDFHSIGLFLFLSVRAGQRRISTVHGNLQDRLSLLWSNQDHRNLCAQPDLLEDPGMSQARELLKALIQAGAKTLQEVRLFLNENASDYHQLSQGNR